MIRIIIITLMLATTVRAAETPKPVEWEYAQSFRYTSSYVRAGWSLIRTEVTAAGYRYILRRRKDA